MRRSEDRRRRKGWQEGGLSRIESIEGDDGERHESDRKSQKRSLARLLETGRVLESHEELIVADQLASDGWEVEWKRSEKGGCDFGLLVV